MKIPRIIPCLLLKGDGLVKGVKFKNHTYIGDPLNAVKIFNDKEVDELVFLDIDATRERRTPKLELIQQIADECYMPFGVGGGINSIEQIKVILGSGAEKVIINTAAVENPELIQEASSVFGAQSIVVSVDVKKNFWGKKQIMTHSGTVKFNLFLSDWIKQIAELGAGEILLNSVDYEGMMAGYDSSLIKKCADLVSIPVIAAGGAGECRHFKDVVDAGAAAASAGSMFVFNGKYKAVLISYPSKEQFKKVFDE